MEKHGTCGAGSYSVENKKDQANYVFSEAVSACAKHKKTIEGMRHCAQPGNPCAECEGHGNSDYCRSLCTAAADIIEQQTKTIETLTDASADISKKLKQATKIIEDMQREKTELEPVVHAHWKKGFYGHPVCSACEKLNVGTETERCPHCGARMDEKNDGGEK